MGYLANQPCEIPPVPTPAPPPPPPPTPAPPPPTVPDCPGGCGLLVTVTTDSYPGETSWELKLGDEVRESNGPFAVTGNDYLTAICLTPGTWSFTIFDDFGDGMCCDYGSGAYELNLEHTVIKQGGEFGESETTDIVCAEEVEEVTQCVDGKFGLNFCSAWCNNIW